jgi:transcription antitermination factor NusG
MENFQSAVSKFTPDVACQIVSNDEMVAGRRVRVLSGQFAGTEGVIEDDASAKGPMRRFAVRFAGMRLGTAGIRVKS